MRERSSHGEVVALRRAMRLVRARRESDEAYDEALDEVYGEINALGFPETENAVADLVHALVRVASAAVLMASTHSGVMSDSVVLDIIDQGNIDSSLDIEHDGPDPEA